MTRPNRALVATICACGLSAVPWADARPSAMAQTSRPRLLVVLVVDQFRAGYVEDYSPQWTKGLKRLLDRGAVYPLAAYPYAVTTTCPGHTTIGTGRLPSSHGMINNSWYDRAERKSVACTEDASAISVPFGGASGREHHSAARMRGPTLADELRRQSNGARVVTMSLKPRSAVGLAGHAGPGVMAIWREDNGAWATSTAYSSSAWPEVEQYVAANPVTSAFGQTWSRLLPDASYKYDDLGAGEGNDPLFPHKLVGRSETPDAQFQAAWERSPWSDRYLGHLAQTLVTRLSLGQRAATDFLGIGFSALDLVGHVYGPRSHEVQDVLAHLDVVIGELLDALDRTVGPNRYVVALSADHGVSDVPEQTTARGLDAGRTRSAMVRDAVEATMDRVVGDGTWVTNVTSPYVYLADGGVAQVGRTPGAREAIASALLAVPGVARVAWSDEIRGASEKDLDLMELRRSYVADRSGDVAFILKPNWLLQSTGTGHGTGQDYDRGVPVIVAGPGVTPGWYRASASPADIAPTLARLAGISLAGADGRVLVESLRAGTTRVR